MYRETFASLGNNTDRAEVCITGGQFTESWDGVEYSSIRVGVAKVFRAGLGASFKEFSRMFNCQHNKAAIDTYLARLTEGSSGFPPDFLKLTLRVRPWFQGTSLLIFL